MGLFIQISIGLFILFIGLLLIIVRRKLLKPKKILILIIVLVLFTLSLYYGIKELAGNRQELNHQEYDIYIAREYIYKGQFDKGSSIIWDLYAEDASNPHYILNIARLKAMEGLLDRAKILYKKSKDQFERKQISGFPMDEYNKLVDLYEERDIQDKAIINYLYANNLSPESYGYTNLSQEVNYDKEVDILKDTIIKNIRKEQVLKQESDKKFEDFNRVAKLVIWVQEIYDEYLKDGKVDQEELSNLVRRFKQIEDEEPDLMENKHVRLARLKVFVLEGAYKGISKLANENSNSDELMILSELYMMGLIKASNFDESFISIDEKVYDKVIMQCEKVYNEKLADGNKEEKNLYKKKITALKNQRKHKVLSEIEYRIIADMDNVPPENLSKLYLQLSKIENYMGNEYQAKEYMNTSIDATGSCSDMNYIAPMHEIMGIITGDNDTEDIKQVARYVEQVVDNALPVRINTPEREMHNNEKVPDFEQYLTNYISKKKSIINIGRIDKSNFSQIKAGIYIDSDTASNIQDLREVLEVYDCGIKIEDFDLEKRQFSTSKVLLLCDISGSMSPNVQELKNAVTQFVDDINWDEQISIVGFDDDIKFSYGFTGDQSELYNAISQLGAFGGTDMYNALIKTLDLFPKDPSSNNVIILMTDGQDNISRSQHEIKGNIGRVAQEGAISIYTLGLGNEVDIEYLTSIANQGAGKFLYVRDGESLKEFYDFIHNQINNQYILTYTAANTIDNYRELLVSITKEGVSDRRNYYLIESEDGISEEDYEKIVSEGGGTRVYGSDTKFLYKSNRDMYINLMGSGFNKDEEVYVEIVDNLSYRLKAQYVDENRMQILIPGGVSIGEYDLKVSIKDTTFKFNRELTIALPGKETVVKYGAYVFTALQKNDNEGDKLVLRGNVTMNGWLKFKGDISLIGNIKDQAAITMVDELGSYVSYNKNNSGGLANTCANLGISVPILPLGDFNLYNDEKNRFNFEDYRTDQIYSLRIPVFSLLIENGHIRLYPDRIQFVAPDINFDLPYQKEIMVTAGYNPFSFQGDINGIISNKNFGLVGKVEIGKDRHNLKLKTFKIVNKLPLGIKEAALEFDTLKNDYSFKAHIYLPMAPMEKDNNDSLGFEFALKGMELDKVMLYADFDYTPVWQPVPLTFSDFGIGLTDMADKMSNGHPQNDPLLKGIGYFMDSSLTGKFDLSAYKLSAFLPKIADFLGDPSLITLADATPKIKLKDFALSFNADIKVFDKIKVGYCDARLGNFEYENALLGIREMDVFGLYFKAGAGIFWESANCNIEASVSTEYTLGYPYIGFWGNGNVITTINWWEFEKDLVTTGDFVMALFLNSDNKIQFSIVIKDIKPKGKIKTRRLDITEGSFKLKF